MISKHVYLQASDPTFQESIRLASHLLLPSADQTNDEYSPPIQPSIVFGNSPNPNVREAERDFGMRDQSQFSNVSGGNLGVEDLEAMGVYEDNNPFDGCADDDREIQEHQPSDSANISCEFQSNNPFDNFEEANDGWKLRGNESVNTTGSGDFQSNNPFDKPGCGNDWNITKEQPDDAMSFSEFQPNNQFDNPGFDNQRPVETVGSEEIQSKSPFGSPNVDDGWKYQEQQQQPQEPFDTSGSGEHKTNNNPFDNAGVDDGWKLQEEQQPIDTTGSGDFQSSNPFDDNHVDDGWKLQDNSSSVTGIFYLF